MNLHRRTFRARLLQTALLAALAMAAAPGRADTGPMDFLFGSGVAPAADMQRGARRVWKLSEFSALRLAPREAGSAANQHPAPADPDLLRSRLAALELVTGPDRRTALFAADELADLVPALVQALAAAGPGDDVLLLSSARRDSGFLSVPQSITARVFVQDGQLQLIVNDARLDAVSLARASRAAPPLVFGRRTVASAVQLRSPQATSRRGDWVAIDLGAGAPAASAGPTERVRPVSPAAARAAEPAPSRPRDAAYYDEQAQRLKGLAKLREQGLITEEEFQQKRREILQGL